MNPGLHLVNNDEYSPDAEIERVAAEIARDRKAEAMAAKLAAIGGVKRTPDLLPHCHPIRVTGVDVTVETETEGRIHVVVTVRAVDRTGVEMEALTGVAAGALSLYDTAKAFDRRARIEGIRLLSKSGGKSGDFASDAQ